VGVLPEQQGHLDMADMRNALQKLPPDQREAVLLVGASGLSYEEAANICQVAVGTIKSRVNRGRNKLAELLKIADPSDLTGDFATASAVSQSIANQA
jgi:RNA polymerase sigma-70 factor (ECF subfamily)